MRGVSRCVVSWLIEIDVVPCLVELAGRLSEVVDSGDGSESLDSLRFLFFFVLQFLIW